MSELEKQDIIDNRKIEGYLFCERATLSYLNIGKLVIVNGTFCIINQFLP